MALDSQWEFMISQYASSSGGKTSKYENYVKIQEHQVKTRSQSSYIVFRRFPGMFLGVVFFKVWE